MLRYYIGDRNLPGGVEPRARKEALGLLQNWLWSFNFDPARDRTVCFFRFVFNPKAEIGFGFSF
jgi:hypothetical protein